MSTKRKAGAKRAAADRAETVEDDVEAEGVKAFSDAKPKVSPMKPLILLAVAIGCAWMSGSVLLGVVLVFAVIANILCDVIVGNLLTPPFQDNREPSRGLTEQVGKVCPYWPKASVRGPAFMGIDYEEVEFPSESGEILRGWLMRGAQSQNGTRETVLIFSHGAGRDRRAWLRHTPFLLDHGYTCLSFDFRGHGVSDAAGVHQGTSLGILEKDDIVSAVRFARKLKPKAKISLIGTSTGAVASILAVAGHSEVRDAVSSIVAENPFAAPESVASHTVSCVVFRVLICKNNSLIYTLLYPLMLLVKVMVHYKLLRELQRKYSTQLKCSEEIRKVATPILFMHGTEDKIVPFRDSELLYVTAGMDAGPLGIAMKNEFWACQDAEHCQLWDKDRKEFEKRVTEFLHKF